MKIINHFKKAILEAKKNSSHLADISIHLYFRPYNLLLFSLFLTIPAKGYAQEPGRIELGIGLAGASLPHYRGSDQRRDYLAPFPYILYEGKRLKVNRDGGQFYFYYHPRFRIDISAALSPPVFSDDNHAREGMDDLHPVFELGPRTQIVLFQSRNENIWIRASFPLRMAIASNLKDTRSAGFVFSPYLQLHIDHKWDADFSIGPIWASEEFHDYVYEVAPKFATADRPAYDAKGGYSGTRISFSTGHRYKGWWFGFFARYDDLSGATFDDSPLVRREESFMAGAAFSTIIYSEKLYSK